MQQVGLASAYNLGGGEKSLQGKQAGSELNKVQLIEVRKGTESQAV